MKKKILLIHTNYRNIGGEDIAVNNEIKFLSKNYEVKSVIFSNKKNIFVDFFIFLFNRNIFIISFLKKEIRDFQPDIAYVHNTWYKGSLSIFKVLNDLNVPSVLKLHNFRYNCTKTYFSKNHLQQQPFCKACGYDSKGIFNKYYKNSYIRSFMVNRFGKAFFKILRDHKINIVVLTEFHKRFLANSGVNSKLVTVFPNYLSIELDNFNTQKKKEKYFIYAGRISKEKGVEELITAFLSCELKKTNLYILGNGPDLNYLENKYKNKNIFFKNQLSNEESIDYIKNAACVVTATKLHEGQPTLLCEASMMKVPSIFPQNGGISEFFPPNYKLSFKQFDYEDLINVFMNLSNYNLEQIGEENYQFFKNSINEDKLTKLIDSLIEKVKK